MAATDQNYRNQYALDIVFAVSSILMLFSVLWMFVQDYNREFKHEQRSFRDVETALAQRAAVAQIPPLAAFDKADQEVKQAREERNKNADNISELRREAAKLQPDKEKADSRYQDIKASLDSVKSFYDIEVDEHGLSTKAEDYKKEVQDLEAKLAEAQSQKDDLDQRIKEKSAKADALEKPLSDAIARMKKVTDLFDTQVNTAINKRWGIADTIRNLPIIDGFASPIKIHQYTIDTIPIDYNFKYAVRFDRCTTCHEGIDRPAFTKTALASLTTISDEQNKRLEEARTILRKRREAVEGLPEAKHMADPDQLKLNEISKDELTGARVREFAAHPRLDLFVGNDSKHPAEKFGCTACHSGQPSATSFNLASHTPNDVHTKERWQHTHDWASNHYWDFPMLPMRFIESSCVKCHHEITDLVSTKNRKEAPKLLRGYTLLKEFGCFGCHEINGRKKGQEIGPDIRLENYPPLEDLPPAERTKIDADPDTRPGNMRKVGPSLFRVSEKVNPDWTVKWLRAPREFRPDTKMPHFYGLYNNSPENLPPEQKSFPDTEIRAISYYLFKASEGYLNEVAARQKDSPEARQKDAARVQELLEKAKLTDEEKKELAPVQARIRQREVKLLTDLAPGYAGDAAQGRLLFSERGCLACHSHESTTKAQGGAGDKTFAPAITSEAQFGPNLSQVAAKLGGKDNNKAQARKWLIQWLMDPHVHSPRSRMPVTHLEPKQAADVAAWLLSQPPQDLGTGWESLEVKQPALVDMQKLADVYLIRLMSKSNLEKLKQKQLPDYVRADLPGDEKEFADKYFDDQGLKLYLGKKAIGRLGCYACHDIPGFEGARPIGAELNEWGKKDPTKIAFEDINSYAHEHYKVVDRLTDDKGKPVAGEGKKMPYEKFFYELLTHHQREGFLFQKLAEPRSYDYNRIRAWDDRLRMPQFRFGRTRKHADESEQDYEARANLEEAEAREAVMTFVLGLVAEPVPVQSVNHPSGDRLGVVKGLQVLEKFNCAGCHLIRPGLFEFEGTTDVTKRLDDLAVNYQNPADFFFSDHFNWLGAPQASESSLTAMGARPELKENEEDPQNPLLQFRLVHAFRYQGADGEPKNIRASYSLQVPPKRMIYPPAEIAADKEKLKRFAHDQGPYGGTFADLLVNFLIQKDPKTYEKEQSGDSSRGRISVPPILIGQGERTQGEWLFQFLLDPQPVRRTTVLRMPKFNMSKDEARALVNYFTGLERILNSGIEVRYPFESMPQQEDLDGAYWRTKTKEYVDRLKRAKGKDAQGKGKTLYDMRVAELTPVWKQVEKDIKEEITRAKSKYEEAKKIAGKADEALKSEKDEARKKQLEDESKDAKRAEDGWSGEVQRLEALAAQSGLDAQEKTWSEREAYITDAFRLVANTQLCLGCHQVGTLQPNQKQQEGPPLHLSAQRLRAGWSKRWVANPQRFLTYNSIMPSNFPANATGQYQQWFAGSSLDQVTAVRDVLMAYPRISALPVNRYWALPLTGEKSEEKKTGAKK